MTPGEGDACFEGPDCAADGCQREVGHIGEHHGWAALLVDDEMVEYLHEPNSVPPEDGGLRAEAAMWAYQYAGALTTVYEFAEGDIVPLLDLLSALAEGKTPTVEWPAVVPSVRAAIVAGTSEVSSIDSLTLAREREAKARALLREASRNPAADPCDDAWMTAAIFQALLDAERSRL